MSNVTSMVAQLGVSVRRWTIVSATVVATTGVVLVAPPADVSMAAAPYPAPVITGYVPLEPDATRQTMLSANSGAGTTLDFTVGITNAGAGAVMYYDHWEDGYETDLTNPTQTTTQVWGNGDPADGNAATYCGARCAGDLLPAGAVFVLRNNIPTPRTTTVLWDGRDRVSSTRGFTITAGGFSTPLGSVLSASASAYDTTKWGTDYWIPVGEDMTPPAGTSDAFSTTSVQVMADQPGTLVEIDKDGNGTTDFTKTIGAGEVAFVNGGLNRGARVRSSKPVQVHLGAGDAGASYELRWFTLLPTALLTADYINPVGASSDNQRTITYLFNPNSSSIVVTPTCTGCAGTITVPARGGAKYASPVSQAVRFQSSGNETFVAVGAAGSESGALPGSSGDNSATYDWGFGLVPTRLLTSKAVIGWAPGNSNNPPATPAGNRDDGPVWVSTLRSTTLYVDFDGNPSTGALGPQCDGLYDTAITVVQGASTKIFDNTDGDMTGASIYTCDGTLLAGAWGEDASNAPSGAPGFDAGYALVPSTAMLVDKTSAIGVDTNSDGRFGPGDIVAYDISIADAGALSFTDLRVTDAIPAGTRYVAGSATYDKGNGVNVPFADNVIPPAATAYPFDEAGAVLPTIDPGTTVHVRYQVVISDPFPAGTKISNIVDVGSKQADGGDVDVIELVAADLSLTKTVRTAPVHLGDDATFRLTVSNAGPDTAGDVQVTDVLPAGLSFVSAAPNAGSYDPATGVWSVGAVAANSSATLDLTATVNSLSVTNTAEITHSFAADPDSTPANGSTTEDDDASATVTVAPLADVSLTKQLIAGPDVSGHTTFRLTLANAGPSPSAGVRVTDHPPTGAKFVSATAQSSVAADGVFDGPTNVWTVPDLAPGAQAQMNVVYDTSAGPGVNYAQVTASTVDDPDSTPDTDVLSDANLPNQDDEASATAPALSDVSVTNSVTTAPTHVGDLVMFTVTAGNDGPNGTTGVAVTDRLPAGLTYVASLPSIGTYDPITGVWAIGDLASGTSQTLTITARVMTPGALTTVAELSSSVVPDVDSTPNNHIFTEDDQAAAGFTTTGASLGDTVWFDIDNNGVVDPDEPGLSGVEVNAVWTNPDGGADVTYTATTDASGAWSLTGLPAGSYVVSVDTSTLPYGITVPTSDRDGIGTPHTATLIVAGGQKIDDVDFAYTGSGLVGDIIFLDADGDGSPDVGEGLGGVAVTLTWVGPDGSSPADDVGFATVTDQFGAYTFANLPAGAFTVAVDTSTLPSGLTNSVDPDGGTANSASITLATGEQRLDADFGYRGTNSIGDTVFADTNGNGVQDAGEVGLGGVVIELLRDIDADGVFETTVATVATSGTGTYVFDLLPAGSYQVALTVPAGLTATTPGSVDVTLLDGDSNLNADFGLRSQPSAPGSIGDVVWNDTNANGVMDGGESGQADVTVTLRSDGNGDGVFETLVATQTSAGNGAYGFANLPAGTYLVSITPPVGRSVTTVVAHTVNLTAGATVDTADFGLSATVDATGSIGDLVWNDADGDGIRDGGESGLSGVTVTLRQDTNGDGIYETPVASTDTDSNGAYVFSSLPAGSYRAVVAVPSGQFATTSTAIDVQLTAGQQVDAVDFGLAATSPPQGIIGDRIWLDSNGDGLQDPTEPGVNDVTVTLLSDIDGDGDYETTVATTTTAGDGNYQFSNVAPGSYRTTATPPNGLTVTTPSPVVALAPGATIDTADIGLTVTPPQPYDLVLTKRADSSGATGALVTWTLTATNNGPVATPADVRVVDTLPAGLAPVSAQGAGWGCATAGQVVTCDHADPIDPAASSTIEVVTRVTATAGAAIINTASVSAAGREITTTNNQASASIVVPAPADPLATDPQPGSPGATVPADVTQPSADGLIDTTPTTVPTVTGPLPSTGGSPNGIIQFATIALALGVLLLIAKRRTNPPTPGAHGVDQPG